MTILDDIGKSKVDVRGLDCSPDTDLECHFDVTVRDLYLLSGERRIWVSFHVTNVDYVREVMVYVLIRLHSVPEVVWVSGVYVLIGTGNIYGKGCRAYICLELDVKTPYQAARVLYSMIAMFCRRGDGWVDFLDVRDGDTRGWSFNTKYSDDEIYDDDSDDVSFVVEHMIGRPLGFAEKERCQKRFDRLFKKMRG